MALKIKKICIEGIRGYKDKKELDFDVPCIFLFGDNGSGKSSTLNAIEWVLFGEKIVGANTGIPERSREERWEIKNLIYSAEPKVAITFTHSDGEYIIERSIIERSKSKLTITKPDKSQLKDDEAEKELYKILQIEFKDFMSSIYQHQEIIRDILVKEPKERNDVLDRLFGFSELKNFISGLKDTNIKNEKEILDGKVKSLSNSISAKISEVKILMDGKKSEAKDMNLSDDQFDINGLENIKNILHQKINEFIQKRDIKNFSVGDLKTKNDFVEVINKIRGLVPETNMQSELTKKRMNMEILYTELKGYEENLKEYAHKVEGYEDEKTMRERIDNVERDIENMKQKMKELNKKSSVVKEAIEYLKLETSTESAKIACPVCGAEKIKKEILSHLEKEWEQNIEKSVKGLSTEINNKEEEKESLQNTYEEYKKLKENIEKTRAEKQKRIERLSRDFAIQVKSQDDPVSICEKELENIKKELEKLGKIIMESNQELNGIHNETGKISLIEEILKLQKRVKELEKINLRDLDNIVVEIGDIENQIENINRAILEVMKNEAQNMIDKAKDKIDIFYKRLVNRNDFKDLEISVSTKKIKGIEVNNYKIYTKKDSKDYEILPIFNMGDMNSIALSIFLGLASSRELEEGIQFLILDDPTQSLDPGHKERLSELLNELAENKQIFVSTMDVEFQDFLKSKITKRKVIYRFEPWDSNRGVCFKKE